MKPKIILNIYGKATTSVSEIYTLAKGHIIIAMYVLDSIQKYRTLIDSEDGTITLYFDKSKYWCEPRGYSEQTTKIIRTALFQEMKSLFGECISMASSSKEKTLLYEVNNSFFEVVYNLEDEIVEIRTANEVNGY